MSFKLGLVQCCHPDDGDVVGMADRWMAKAARADVDIVVFPESLMTPYELEPVEFGRAAEPLDGPFCNEMLRLASAHRLWTVFTMNERGPQGDGGGRPYNTAVVADSDGERRAVYRKVHLFDTDFTKESAKVAAGGELFVPLETPFCKLGLGICYDVRFPELARDAALAGCEVLLYPAAWVDGPGKVRQWKTLLSARAIENELFVAGLSRCDRAFGAARRDYAGNSCVFDPLGVPIAEAGIDEELLVAEIDLAAIASVRAAMPVLSHRRTDLYA